MSGADASPSGSGTATSNLESSYSDSGLRLRQSLSAWSVSPSTGQSGAGALDAPGARRLETRPQPWGSPLGPCVVTRRFRGSSGGEEGPLLGSGGIASAPERRRWERPPSSAGCVGPWRPARVLTLLLVIVTPPVTGSKVLLVPVSAPVKPNREQRATPLRSPKFLPTSPKDSSKTFIGSPLPTQDTLRRFLKRTADRRETPPVRCALTPPRL